MKSIYNIGIERAILASILFNPDIADRVQEELVESDFGHVANGKIFNAICDLKKLDQPINDEFIRNRLNRNLDNDLLEILATAPIVDLESYISEIKNLALKRKLHSLAMLIKEKSLDLNTPSIDIIDEIEREVFSFHKIHTGRDFRDFDSITESLISNITNIKDKGNRILIGLDTGFSELNKITAGFKEGELIILAARPAMGKTALAINIARTNLEQGKAVALFSLEMDAEQIALRMFSSITSIPLQRLRVGDLDDDEWIYFANKADNISSSWKFYIDDSGLLNISVLKSKIRKLKIMEPSISLVIIDYLQIMSGLSNKERHLEIAEISRGLKNLARELKIPILALSQLNRSLESRSDRRPMLSDLRESGAIEQDADIILFLYRDAVYRRRDQKEKFEKAKKEGTETPKEEILREDDIEDVELIIGKHRNGAIGTIPLKLHTKYTRFVNVLNLDVKGEKETKIIDDVLPL